MTDALAGKRIWIAGQGGMVGRALARRLAGLRCTLVTPASRIDLRDQSATYDWIARQHIDLILLAAARVGGIRANLDRPGEFLFDNLLIQANVIEGARRAGVTRLIAIGSSALYPQDAPQPIVEQALLTGPLDPAHEGYAIAKIAGAKLCETYARQYGCAFTAVLPTNLYGPFDNFALPGAHVLPALLRRLHEAKLANAPSLAIWGSGRALREFLHVDDLADALIAIAERPDVPGPINIGSGDEISIADLARLISDIVDYRGMLAFDSGQPDGVPRKRLDSTRLCALGWRSTIDLRSGVEALYKWYLAQDETTIRRD